MAKESVKTRPSGAAALSADEREMLRLKNRKSREQALADIAAEPFDRMVMSFYRYAIIDEPVVMRNRLFSEWSELGVLGRIYVSGEGINAQLSVPEPRLEEFKAAVDAIPEFSGMFYNIALAHENDAFWKLQIKVKKQIVHDGLEAGSYDVTDPGRHLSAAEFNAAMESGDAIVVDMRNGYESRVGKFEGAVTPDVETFREELEEVRELLADKKDKKVLLYCTGGIRCEKTSAYLKHEGFSDVNQLQGGIINYTKQVEAEGLENKFIGKNFTFDGRLGERVTEDVLTECDGCGVAWDDYSNCTNELCNRLFLNCESCTAEMKGACGEECKSLVEMAPEEFEKFKAEWYSTHRYTLDSYKKSVRA